MTSHSFPKPASSTLDWSSIGLQGFDEASHVEVLYDATNGGWGSPEIVQDPWVKVHGLSPGLNYGQQCYEGLKAFRTVEERILMFRPIEHARRMIRSAEAISCPPVPESLFLQSVNMAITANSQFVPPHDTSFGLYIRPLLYGSSGMLAPTAPKQFRFCVYIQPASAYLGAAAQDAIVLEEVDRAAPRGVGNVKIGGNYAPMMKFTDQARRQGYGLTLHLDSATRTEIDEFSLSGFIGIKDHNDHVTMVVPKSPNAIASITVDTCIEVAKTMGWTVELRSVKWDELYYFTEVLAVGTALLLLPTASISRLSSDEKIVYCNGSRDAGPRCLALRTAIDDIMRGRKAGPPEWCIEVQEPSGSERSSMLAKTIIEAAPLVKSMPSTVDSKITESPLVSVVEVPGVDSSVVE